ncbi:MAG: Peptidase M23 family protein [Candidatus Peregrinibacteria bacterium GW2011_GWA2_44_7]|nr:MAG: Peptidase M23 family protein [Candidatus Peregrinibacteria bacterium GW2011_GWA2_44_7]
MSFADAYDVGGNYVEGYEIEINPDEIALVEDGGYLLNISPSTTTEARYLDRTQETTHEVQSGETLSKIAYLYDLKVNSIFWANQDKLSSINALKVGQQLMIPVADGYKIKIKDGDNLADLIKKYKGKEDETKQLAWNGIPEGSLTAGQEILIVGGQPYVTVATARISGNTGGGGGTSKGVAPAGVVPSPGGEGWFKPVSGTLTQGYHAGHYAYDIAGARMSPIMTAAAGTVIKASSGTWGGGYGTHVIIQHDNGCETLYAHNTELYVANGDYVSGGQVIAAMGNTGRVYGRTGVHAHIELRCNGVKVNPAPLFGW